MREKKIGGNKRLNKTTILYVRMRTIVETSLLRISFIIIKYCIFLLIFTRNIIIDTHTISKYLQLNLSFSRSRTRGSAGSARFRGRLYFFFNDVDFTSVFVVLFLV